MSSSNVPTSSRSAHAPVDVGDWLDTFMNIATPTISIASKVRPLILAALEDGDAGAEVAATTGPLTWEVLSSEREVHVRADEAIPKDDRLLLTLSQADTSLAMSTSRQLEPGEVYNVTALLHEFTDGAVSVALGNQAKAVGADVDQWWHFVYTSLAAGIGVILANTGINLSWQFGDGNRIVFTARFDRTPPVSLSISVSDGVGGRVEGGLTLGTSEQSTGNAHTLTLAPGLNPMGEMLYDVSIAVGVTDAQFKEWSPAR
jgi:hypothetical protein